MFWNNKIFLNMPYKCLLLFVFLGLVMGTSINAIVCAGFAHIRFAEYTKNVRTLSGTAILHVH